MDQATYHFDDEKTLLRQQQADDIAVLESQPKVPYDDDTPYDDLPTSAHFQPRRSLKLRICKGLIASLGIYLITCAFIHAIVGIYGLMSNRSFFGDHDHHHDVPVAVPEPGDGTVHQCIAGGDWVSYDHDHHHDHFPFHAQSTLSLPVADAEALYFFSRGSYQAGAIDVVSSGEAGDEAEVVLTVGYHHQHVLDHASVCHLERADNEYGVGILTPKWLPSRQGNHHMLNFHATVKLPAGSDNSVLQVKKFETDMSIYVHRLGDLAQSTAFQHLSLKTSNTPIHVESVSVEEGYIQTSNSPISGHFSASSHLRLHTANSPIKGEIYLLNQGDDATSLDVRTTNGNIDTAVSLSAASPDSDGGPGTGGAFDVRANTANAPLRLTFASSPAGSKLRASARTANAPATVTLHSAYEGTFHAETSLLGATLVTRGNVEDPAGRGRTRVFEDVRKGRGAASGAVYWADEEGGREGRGRGRVEVKTSVSPVKLVV